MKRLMKVFVFFTIMLGFCLVSGIALSQGGPGGPCDDPYADPCNCTGQEPPEWCPIDGGIIALLAAGVGIGLKRVRDTRKKTAALED